MSKRRRFRWPRPGRGMSGDAAGRQTWQQPGRPRSRSGGEKERGPSTSDEVAIRSQGKWPRRPSPLRTLPRGRLRGCRGRCHGRGRLVYLFCVLLSLCHPHALSCPSVPSPSLKRSREVDEAAVASTDVAARTTAGMSREMPRAWKVSVFFCVYFCHYAILTPFPARLFPLLP